MSESKSIIDAKTAVVAAYEYLRALQDVLGNPLKNLALEEVELSSDDQVWLITLGYDRSASSIDSFLGTSPNEQRAYKLFRINSETGEVEAMKIREV